MRSTQRLSISADFPAPGASTPTDKSVICSPHLISFVTFIAFKITMEKLFALGFLPSASVQHLQDGWSIEIANNRNAANILYAFVFVSGQGDNLVSQVAYIGHTRKAFENRMRGYEYGNGQAVNHRVHTAISHHLELGGRVEVLCLPNTNRMTIHDIPVDVAAGLEYGLISFFAQYNEENGHPPLLNMTGNPIRQRGSRPVAREDEALAQHEQIEENLDYPDANLPIAPQQDPKPSEREARFFELTLTEKTYWPAGSINVPMRFTDCFGIHGGVVSVTLIADGHSHDIEAVINRTANLNGSPRLLFQGENGKLYREWKQRYHILNSVLRVNVNGTDSISVQ